LIRAIKILIITFIFIAPLCLSAGGRSKQSHPSDEEIKKRIVDQLYGDSRVDAADISVRVENGEVVLEGTVPNYSSRLEAYSDVWKVSGVRFVKNEIEVSYKPPAPSDENMEKMINSSLKFNSTIDSSEIRVSVYSGEVTLEGSVANIWEKLKAEDIAAEVRGVRGISNEIAIIPEENILDELIAMQVVEAIDRDSSVDVDMIDVKVENGIVTLSGTVPDWRARAAAFDAALFTAGVKHVENDIALAF
jgi:osmotically-inducible protein OsmY